MNKDKNVHDSVANMKYIEVLRTHKYSVEIPESKKSQMGKAARSTCTIDRVAEVTGSVKSPPGGDTSAKKIVLLRAVRSNLPRAEHNLKIRRI